MVRLALGRFYYLIALIATFFVCYSSWAVDRRIALLIGNSAYQDAPLKNPFNDATDMAKTLAGLGFKVNKLLDADARTMKQAIRNLGKELAQEETVGLFYFAGHGLQVDGVNYLVPINAHIESEADIEYEAINAGRVLSQMSLANNVLNLIILDACRNNPFARSFRSSTRGLARMEAPKGSLILYATSPGDVASDGVGRNGLFTEKLMETIGREGLTIEQVFKETAIAVDQASNSAQVPYLEGVILGDFYFKEASAKIADNPPIQPQQQRQQQPRISTDIIMASEIENTFWDAVQETGSTELYQAYLEQYPKGFYSRIAKIKIRNATLLPKNDEKSKEEKNRESPAVTEDELVAEGKKPIAEIKSRVSNDPSAIEMAKIPRGCFKMGSFQGDDSEKPMHTVCITKPFMMGKYEVTQGQWMAIMQSNPSFHKISNDHPVENVSWDDAQHFISILNKKTGLNYRLPTEAEWEYACNGETPKQFCGGNQSDDVAWYGEEWDSGHHLVGTKLPNAFGLYDMSGNVWE